MKKNIIPAREVTARELSPKKLNKAQAAVAAAWTAPLQMPTVHRHITVRDMLAAYKAKQYRVPFWQRGSEKWNKALAYGLAEDMLAGRPIPPFAFGVEVGPKVWADFEKPAPEGAASVAAYIAEKLDKASADNDDGLQRITNIITAATVWYPDGPKHDYIMGYVLDVIFYLVPDNAENRSIFTRWNKAVKASASDAAGADRDEPTTAVHREAEALLARAGIDGGGKTDIATVADMLLWAALKPAEAQNSKAVSKKLNKLGTLPAVPSTVKRAARVFLKIKDWDAKSVAAAMEKDASAVSYLSPDGKAAGVASPALYWSSPARMVPVVALLAANGSPYKGLKDDTVAAILWQYAPGEAFEKRENGVSHTVARVAALAEAFKLATASPEDVKAADAVLEKALEGLDL